MLCLGFCRNRPESWRTKCTEHARQKIRPSKRLELYIFHRHGLRFVRILYLLFVWNVFPEASRVCKRMPSFSAGGVFSPPPPSLTYHAKAQNYQGFWARAEPEDSLEKTGESENTKNQKSKSTPDPDIFQNYRNTPPTSIAILLQKYALPLAESSIYPTNLYHDTPPICIAILLQKY